MLKNMKQSTKQPTKLKLQQEEVLSCQDKSTSQHTQKLPSLSESEVSTSSTLRFLESSGFLGSDKSTMEFLLELTRLHPTYSVELSHTLPSDTLHARPSENWSWREDTERWTSKEFLFLTMKSSMTLFINTTSITLRILLTKSIQLEPTSKKLTTSSGHSNLELQEEDSLPRDIPSKDKEIGEIERSTSTNW